MTIYDYAVIAFYLLFMLLLGPVYKSFSKTASDYFRGGGGMLWWVVGSSAFMVNFSAWSFTGGAAKAYETGTFFLLLFACNFVSLFFCYFFTAAKFRQMRVITPIEAVYKRFGAVNEQVFTWLPIPFNIIFGGIGLYTISVFMTGVFNVPMEVLIVVLGITVTVMTLLGGSWAATAGDFVQMLVLLTITMVMAFLTLRHPDIGGVTNLINKLPPQHFDWTCFDRLGVIIFFAVTLLINQLVQGNSMMTGAARYIFVKDGKDAKKAVIMSILGFLLLSPIWMVPAVAATILHPNLAAEYPNLNNPNEAAYVAMAVTLLPRGLMGLLVCGIFAASMTSMNSAFNIASGTFVRNFYIKIIDKKASESKQIFIGRAFILVYGMLWIMMALYFRSVKSMQLFDLILLAAASIGIPTATPLFFGMFIKKTPSWSGWCVMLIGLLVSITLRFILSEDLLQRLFNPQIPFNARELGDLNIAVTTIILFAVCISTFLFSMLFYKKSPKDYANHIDEFFNEMNTPVDIIQEKVGSVEGDIRQYNVLGNLCIIYGLAVCLLLLIPNPVYARLCILFCGGLILLTGLVLSVIARRIRAKVV